jgi:hypothetical protein
LIDQCLGWNCPSDWTPFLCRPCGYCREVPQRVNQSKDLESLACAPNEVFAPQEILHCLSSEDSFDQPFLARTLAVCFVEDAFIAPHFRDVLFETAKPTFASRRAFVPERTRASPGAIIESGIDFTPECIRSLVASRNVSMSPFCCDTSARCSSIAPRSSLAFFSNNALAFA